jgi:phospholipase/carboxylesterase
MQAEEIEGQALPYVLLRPDGFAPGAGYPLIAFLHGYGASMYDLVSLGPEIDATGYAYAFPNAPLAVPLGYGRYGYSWFVREGMEPPADPPDVVELLEGFLDEVKAQTGTPDGQIVLGGFSQGGGLTLRYGLPRPDVFAGLACLSGFFRDAEALRPLLPAKRAQPIFVAHGRYDPMVSLERGRATQTFLEAEGYTPVYREYDMAHQIVPDELSDLRSWLRDVLPPRKRI